VAHLTTERASNPADKEWDVGAICAELFPLIRRFAQTADTVREGFRSDVLARLAALSPPAQQKPA